ncbi:MAG: hypothetical protein JWP44_5037 [Mucilaginibacter sp.]|nr:hypothetical protein [Mucilaginibacter sp.]
MKKFIHVNQHVIKHNNKYDNTLQACRVQYGKYGPSRYCKEVTIKGESKLVYSPDKPLPCGAKLWIECDDDVELIGEVAYETIKKTLFPRIMPKIKKINV